MAQKPIQILVRYPIKPPNPLAQRDTLQRIRRLVPGMAVNFANIVHRQYYVRHDVSYTSEPLPGSESLPMLPVRLVITLPYSPLFAHPELAVPQQRRLEDDLERLQVRGCGLHVRLSFSYCSLDFDGNRLARPHFAHL